MSGLVSKCIATIIVFQSLFEIKYVPALELESNFACNAYSILFVRFTQSMERLINVIFIVTEIEDAHVYIII